MEIIIKSPALCTTDELEKITDLILIGGEVASSGLYQRVKNCEMLGFAKDEDGNIVSVGALKRPVSSYKNRVFEKAGKKRDANSFNLELGFLYTNPQNRNKGLSNNIMSQLVKSLRGKPCFSTLREDNTVSKSLLEKQRFSRLGNLYKGVRGDYNLMIYTINYPNG